MMRSIDLEHRNSEPEIRAGRSPLRILRCKIRETGHFGLEILFNFGFAVLPRRDLRKSISCVVTLQVSAELQQEVLMSLIQTDPDIIDYLLRRKLR